MAWELCETARAARPARKVGRPTADWLEAAHKPLVPMASDGKSLLHGGGSIRALHRSTIAWVSRQNNDGEPHPAHTLLAIAQNKHGERERTATFRCGLDGHGRAPVLDSCDRGWPR